MGHGRRELVEEQSHDDGIHGVRPVVGWSVTKCGSQAPDPIGGDAVQVYRGGIARSGGGTGGGLRQDVFDLGEASAGVSGRRHR
jgi:hypothetical protein